MMLESARPRDERVRRVATALRLRCRRQAARLKAEGESRTAKNARLALLAVAARLKTVIATLPSRR